MEGPRLLSLLGGSNAETADRFGNMLGSAHAITTISRISDRFADSRSAS